MNINLNEFLTYVINIALLILVPMVSYYIIKIIIDLCTRKIKKGKRLTYWNLARSISKYVAIFASIFAILKYNGADVASMLTGVGIASVIAGLAMQDALKDIIMGFNIIADNYFNVGDVIRFDGTTGKVIEIGFKATKILNIKTKEVETIANRNIIRASVLPSQFEIDVPLPYEENLDRIEKVLAKILEDIKEELKINNAEYCGVQEFADSAIVYKLRFSGVKPETQYQVARNARGIIKRELDKAHIDIPYQQIDIRNKK